MRNPSIPIVTYALVRPFAAELQRRGIDPDPVLHQVGLEPEAMGDEDVFISAQNWYDFSGAAAQAADDPQLGYRIGAGAALQSLPNLRVLEFQHATLGELLTALVIDVQRFSTIARYNLCMDGTSASLDTSRNFVPRSPPSQIDGYFAGFMVRLLSLCTGPGWSPGDLTIHVCNPGALPDRTTRECRVFRGGLEGARFRFPAVWLLRRTDGLARQPGLKRTRTSADFMESFRAMLDLHLEKQGLTVAVFAAYAGQSASTLKRRLRRNGTSFRAELDNCRAARARFLLEASDETVGEIGARVGYPDPPSFSRVFQRWTAATPVEFRKRQKSRYRTG